MGIPRRRYLAGLGLAVAAAGISAAGYGAARYLAGPTKAATAAAAVKPVADVSQAQYTCSMHPQILQDHPGVCPICGMALVRLADGSTVHHNELVHVDQDTQKKMGVQLASADVGDMGRAVHAYATIVADDSGVVSVSPKVEGWLRSAPLQGVGQPVRRGQILYTIYSPELQQRQREYIDMLTRRDGLLGDGGMPGASSSGTGNGGLLSPNAAMIASLAKEKFRLRERLIAADMSPDLVDKLEKDRHVQDVVAVRATHDGLVTALAAHEGSAVTPAQPILSYANYSKVWAEVQLYPDQLAWIKNGDEVAFRSALDKSATQRARIDLAYVQIDAANRSAKLRLALNNPHGAFLPGAYADAEIRANSQRVLNVPRDAVIRTGHGDFVVVAEAGDHFRSARVTTGIENNDAVAILSGLKAGQRVAVNGQFLLDGAASMQALQARLAGAAAPAAASSPAVDMAAMPGMGHTHGMQP